MNGTNKRGRLTRSPTMKGTMNSSRVYRIPVIRVDGTRGIRVPQQEHTITMPHSPTMNQVELDELFEVLSHPHRRRILTSLNERNPREEGEFSLAELITEEEIDEETTGLFHNHLPKLDEAGFIDWDRERHLVRRGPRFAEVEPLIELMVNHTDELPADWL